MGDGEVRGLRGFDLALALQRGEAIPERRQVCGQTVPSAGYTAHAQETRHSVCFRPRHSGQERGMMIPGPYSRSFLPQTDRQTALPIDQLAAEPSLEPRKIGQPSDRRSGRVPSL